MYYLEIILIIALKIIKAKRKIGFVTFLLLIIICEYINNL